MLSVALQWRRARWLRHIPGKSGLVLLGVAPLLFLAPFQDIPTFITWDKTAITLFWLGTVAATGYLGGDSGVVGRDDIWPYQKSIALVDWHVCNWLLDAGAILVLLLWLALWFALGQNLHSDWNIQGFAAVLSSAGFLFLVAHCFTFLIGASGIARGIDVFFIASILGIFRNVMFLPLPGVLRVPLRAILPPVTEAYSAGTLLVQGERSAIGPLLSVLTYSFVCYFGAILLLRRAKPPV